LALGFIKGRLYREIECRSYRKINFQELYWELRRCFPHIERLTFYALLDRWVCGGELPRDLLTTHKTSELNLFITAQLQNIKKLLKAQVQQIDQVEGEIKVIHSYVLKNPIQAFEAELQDLQELQKHQQTTLNLYRRLYKNFGG